MRKTAIIQSESPDDASPCEVCGHPSVTVLNGTPYCGNHARPHAHRNFEVRIEAIDKVAADLNPSK